MNYKKTVALLLASAVAASIFAGCNNKNEAVSQTEITKDTITTTDTYPQKSDGELRYWMTLPANTSANFNSFNDTKLKQWLIEQTGINVKYEHPVTGQENAAFNILLSSDDIPDIIEWGWGNYTGGPQKAIDEGIILPLNSYIDNVSPNLKAILKENPEWIKQITTDKGDIFEYPFIRESDKLSSSVTFIIRKDLLDKASLPVPETIDEWEKALYAFKAMGVKAPLSIRIGNICMEWFSPFMGAFGIAGTFYHDKNNTVKFGPYEPEFGEYVKKLNKWYADGILDKEFVDEDANRRAAMVSNGENGAIDATIGGEFGNFISAIKEDSGIKYVAATIPVKNKGDVPMYAQKDFPIKDCAAISATSKYKELAARYLDFGYSKEGGILYNFGKENVSFVYKDKVPTYTDLIMDTKKSGGLSIAQALPNYTRASVNGPFVQAEAYIEQYYSKQEQRDALNMLKSDTLEYKLPNLNMTAEEQKKYSDIMAAVDTYREETVAKIISGKLDLNYLDTYFNELKKMGIEDAISIKQAAYDRYLKKKNITLD